MRRSTAREEQVRLVEIWRASGGPIGVFARAHGINRETFRGWVARERTRAEREPVRGFLEVVPRAAVSVGEDIAVGVTVGGVDVRFSPAPPPAWFAALLRELAAC